MNKSARIFNCTHCHIQVIICSFCDRGNIYCKSCSRQARIINHRIANQLYQKTPKGRQNHAQRQRRYRQRQKEERQKVTDQGSKYLPPDVSLVREPIDEESSEGEQLYCHFCKRAVSIFLRNGFLRHYSENKENDSARWPLGP